MDKTPKISVKYFAGSKATHFQLAGLPEATVLDAFIDECIAAKYPADIDTVYIYSSCAHHVEYICTRLVDVFPAIRHLHICSNKECELELYTAMARAADQLASLWIQARNAVLPVMSAGCRLQLDYGLETASPRFIANNMRCETSNTLGLISDLWMSQSNIAIIDLSHQNMQSLQLSSVVTLKSVTTSAPVCCSTPVT